MTRWTLSLAVAAVLSAGAALSAQSGQALFEKALAKERVEGNLREAVALYEQVVREHRSDRALAAKALVQIGRCYEKLGNAEARKAYERVVREFGDQAQAAEARVRLMALDASAASPAAPAVGTRRLWEGTEIFPDLSSVSPDGRFVSFADFSAGNLSIRDLVSGETRPLTGKRSWNDSKEFADRNLFSRDGKHVAYTWTSGNGSELRVVGVDGSQPRQLFRREDVGFVRAMDWSADSKRVLVMLYRKRQTELALISVADGSIRTVKTFTGGSPEAACLTRRGGYVAYDLPASDQAPARDVHLVAIDGGHDAAVVQDPSDDRVLGCSPDGAHVLFVSDRAGSFDAWMLDVENGGAGGLPRLVKSNLGERAMPLGFAGAGRFLYGLYPVWEDVYTTELDAATRKPAAPPTVIAESGRFVGSNVAPDWSPDGRFVAYFSDRRNTASTGATPKRIVVRSLDTGAEHTLSPNLYYMHRRLRWSPDGSQLAVSGWNESTRETYGIYLIDAKSGEVRRIAQSDSVLRYPAWSPQANVIYYVKHNTALVRKALDTGEERTIYQVPVSKWQPSIQGLEVSPDGQSVAWCIEQRDPTPGAESFMSSLMVSPEQGGEPRSILENKGAMLRMTPMTWTRDGRAIVLLKNNQGFGPAVLRSSLWWVPVTGEPAERMSIGRNVLYQFRIRPDGRGVAFDSGEFKAEIWSLDNILPQSRPAR